MLVAWSNSDEDALKKLVTLVSQELHRLAKRYLGRESLRFFGGLDLEETAEVPQVSVGTVRRDWTFARAWLYREQGGKKDA
jgi:DNA-directed RNA polymerase specialized sigma24 family protein